RDPSLMGEKIEHIELPLLYGLVCGVAVMDAPARNHIENCEQCKSEVVWLQWLAGFGVRERTYDPPALAQANAEDVFPLKKPGLVTIARQTIANLVYDSFSEPLPIGVRQRDLPSRQALYRTENLQLDLKIEVGDEEGLIIGQVVADKGDINVNGLEIEIT